MPPVEEEWVDPTAAMLTQCVWESAVISYGRCFETGKGHLRGRSRTAFPADLIDGLSAEHGAAHAAVREERKRHVAHRANRRQRAQALIALTDPPDEPGIATVDLMIVHQVVDRDLPGQLLALAGHLAEQMKPRIAEQRESLAADWNGRLDEAYARARRQPPPPIDLGSGGSVVNVVFFDV